jgi:hypothetical protein
MIITDTPNLVDDSVTLIRNAIPYQLKAIGHIFRKYTKLIFEAYEEISSYKLGLLDKALNDVSAIPYTKLLFILNRDALVDMNNEISNIPNTDYQWRNKIDFKDIKTSNDFNGNSESYNIKAGGRVKVTSIMYKYMLAPYVPLHRFLNNLGSSQLTYTLPLIRVTPKINFDTFNRKANDCPETLQDGWHMQNSGNINIFGIGSTASSIEATITIDIESILNIFLNYILTRTGNESGDFWQVCDVEKMMRAKEWFTKLSDEEFEKMLITEFIDKDFSRRIVFSATTTFLATVTKLINIDSNFIGELSEDILDVVKEDLTDDVVFDGDVDRGSFMRYMTTNISTLMNAMLLTKQNNDDEDLFLYLKELVNTQFNLKYCTYNYMKVPGDNLKHKNLNVIGYMAKMSNYLVSRNNKLSLAGDFESKKNGGISSFFLSTDTLRINGTFALNKRFFDLGRRLLQELCFFIILRYRLAGLDRNGTNLYELRNVDVQSGVNVNGQYADSDSLGKNKKDYKQYLLDQHLKLKRSIGTLMGRILSLTEGSVINTSTNPNNMAFKNTGRFADIVYGLTNESVASNTDVFYLMKYVDDNTKVDKFGRDVTKADDPEKVLAAISLIAARQLKKMESKYDNIKGMTSNNVHNIWFTLINKLSRMADLPWGSEVGDNAFSILEFISGWTNNTITQITPNVDNVDINNTSGKKDNYCWNESTKQNIDKFQVLEGVSALSREDLEKVVGKLERRSGDEDLFGLFTTPDLAESGIVTEVTKLERENRIRNLDNLSPIEKQAAIDDKIATESLIKRFDKFLNDNF